MQIQHARCVGSGASDHEKNPDFGEKENLDVLASQYQSPIIQEKLKMLGEKYESIRKVQKDGDTFYRSFLFAYLEHIWESQDTYEFDCITANLEACKETYKCCEQNCDNFEELCSRIIQLMKEQTEENSKPRSHQEFLSRSLTQWSSSSFMPLLRCAATNELDRQAYFSLRNPDVDYKEEYKRYFGDGTNSIFMHIRALSDALCVPIRVVYLNERLDKDGSPSLSHDDFIPANTCSGPDTNNIHAVPPSSGTCTSEESISDKGCIPKDDPLQSGSNPAATNPLQSDATARCFSISHQMVPFITLLCRPGEHYNNDYYDVLYPKAALSSPAELTQKLVECRIAQSFEHNDLNR